MAKLLGVPLPPTPEPAKSSVAPAAEDTTNWFFWSGVGAMGVGAFLVVGGAAAATYSEFVLSDPSTSSAEKKTAVSLGAPGIATAAVGGGLLLAGGVLLGLSFTE